MTTNQKILLTEIFLENKKYLNDKFDNQLISQENFQLFKNTKFYKSLLDVIYSENKENFIEIAFTIIKNEYSNLNIEELCLCLENEYEKCMNLLLLNIVSIIYTNDLNIKYSHLDLFASIENINEIKSIIYENFIYKNFNLSNKKYKNLIKNKEKIIKNTIFLNKEILKTFLVSKNNNKEKNKIFDNMTMFLEYEYFPKKLYKLTNCSSEGLKILQFLIKNYLNSQNNNFTIIEILNDYYQESYLSHNNELDNDKENNKEDNKENNLLSQKEIDSLLSPEEFENYDFIYLISEIKELKKLGWIKLAKDFNNINKNLSNFEFLNENIYIDNDFFKLIENQKNIENNFYNINKEYLNYNEYLDDNFNLFSLMFKKLNEIEEGVDEKSPKIKIITKKIKEIKKSIDKKISNTTIELPSEKIFKKENFSDIEKTLVLILLKATLTQNNEEEIKNQYNKESFLLKLLNSIEKNSKINKKIFDRLDEQGEDIYEYEDLFFADGSIKRTYYLTDDFFNLIYPNHIQENEGSLNKSEKEKENLMLIQNIIKDNKIFDVIQSKITLDQVVLNDETAELINILLNNTNKNVQDKLIKWGYIKENTPLTAKAIFHGLPGTGKSMSAEAIGNVLNKNILSFDCSKILSKFVGESEGNVKQIFTSYREISKKTNSFPILLLNEADQFLSKRTSNSDSASKMHNRMQNIFLEEIEKFEGILILTTNLIENFDKAFSRRFNYKIEFKIPSKKQRKEIWFKHLSKKTTYEKEFYVKNVFSIDSEAIDKLSDFELSGGQISLVIKNIALKTAIKENEEIFLLEDFLNEIEKEKNAAFDTDKIIGFSK